MGYYSMLLARWSHYVLSFVVLVVVACVLLAVVIIPFPTFNDPILGFEARGTTIKGQEQVILKLQEPEEYDLTFVPPVPFKDEVFVSPLVIWTYVRYLRSALDASINAAPSQSLSENANQSQVSSQELPTSCEGRTFSPKTPKIVFASKDGETLLTERSVRSMCSLEKQLTMSLDPDPCSHRLSITYYLELRTGKPCEELDEGDINTLLDDLHFCIPYYERGQLTEICDYYTCADMPLRCRKAKAMYNIIHYLTDNQFFHRDENQVKFKEKLTYALLSVTDLNIGYKSFYRNYIEKALLMEGDVFVKAVDSRVKFELFNDYLLEDMVLFGVAMLLILLSMFLYLRSFVVTFATVLNVVFTLLISYCIYYIILGIDHFPFINMLTGLICIAISADDVFIFYDTWQQMKSEFPEDKLSVWMSKTLSHAALSIFVTSLTTASAFFSNIVSEITDIKCFGIFSGVSIMCNFALMITWIPSVVVLLEKYGGSCCSEAKCCSFYEKFNHCLSKMNIIFERFLPLIVIKTWFLWLIVLLLLGAGGIVVLFVEPRLELPTSREFQVFRSSDPMEIWDLEIKEKFRYIKNDVNDITTQGLPVTIVWGLEGNDNGNHLDPSDMGKLELTSYFNMSSVEAQTWMEDMCRDFKNSSFIDPTMKHVPCTISIFNDMMKLPCEVPELQPCCGSKDSAPFPEAIFSECFPKIVSAFQFILEKHGRGLPPVVSIGTPVYSKGHTDNTLIGYTMTAMGNQAWSPILGRMETFLGQLETFLGKGKETAPTGVQDCWITSAFKFYDLQRALSSGTYVAIGVSVAVAFGVMLVTSLNFFITLYALITIILSISVTVGSLVLLGWKLNILESITISLAVGLSIDFTIHYGVAYRLSKSEKRDNKVRESFMRVGSSVAMAAFTTFIAGVAMIPAKVLAYTQLGIFLMLVMTISWAYATLFFQSLCRIMGPKKTVNSFRICRGKGVKVIKERSSNGWDPDHNSLAMHESHNTKKSSDYESTNGTTVVHPETDKTVPSQSNGVEISPRSDDNLTQGHI